jgi:hypothetical protein
MFVLSAALLSVVLTQAQEPKPASTGDEGKARAAAETPRRPVNINPLPFVQLAEKGRMMAEAGRLGPDAKLDLVATAELNEDGSFKPETVKLEWREAGDEHLVELAQQLVTAVGQSKLLALLDGHAKTVSLTARLDRDKVTLGLESEFASEADALNMATGFGALVLVARNRRAGTSEGTLYEALKITSDGKLFRLSFEMSKEAVAKTVAEMLDRRAARNQQ